MTEDKNAYFKTKLMGADRAMAGLPRPNYTLAEQKFGRPDRTIVGMGDGKVVVDGSGKTELFTFGASGCNVVAVAGQAEKPFGALAHYPPTHIGSNVAKLQSLAGEIGGSQKVKAAEAEVFVRGDWEKQDNKWVMVPQDPHETGLLIEAVKNGFGDNTVVKITPYSEGRKSGMESQGTVTVNIRPERKKILGIF